MRAKRNERRQAMAKGHWRDTPKQEKRRLLQTGLQCPGCGGVELGPLDPGAPQLVCGTCWRILDMDQRLRLRIIGRVVDGVRRYDDMKNRIQQQGTKPRRLRHQ